MVYQTYYISGSLAAFQALDDFGDPFSFGGTWYHLEDAQLVSLRYVREVD